MNAPQGCAADGGNVETEQKNAAGVGPRETLLCRIGGARGELEVSTLLVLEQGAQ